MTADADEPPEVVALEGDETRAVAVIAYWQSLNNLPTPEGRAPPEHDLEYYEGLSFPHAPGHW